jgi:hydroxymethylbilane synthase
MTTLRIGARGSDLSLTQTRWLLARLAEARPDVTTEIVIIETTGDRDQHTQLGALWPPGGFVKEIQHALLEERVDAAVHSLKDLPTEHVPGLTLGAVPVRAPAGDVLLTREPMSLDALPEGLAVGTSSPRREALIREIAPSVVTKPIRGNVPTRIEKMMRGDYDAIVLAVAGLERLGIEHPHRCELPIETFLPAPGQGALAAEVRDGSEAESVFAAIDHAPTRAAVVAERAFLSAVGGGCHAPLGAHGIVGGDRITVRTWLFDSGRSTRGEASGPVGDGVAIGEKLAGEALDALGMAPGCASD